MNRWVKKVTFTVLTIGVIEMLYLIFLGGDEYDPKAASTIQVKESCMNEWSVGYKVSNYYCI